MADINFPAVLAAAVSSFVLGGLWYSKLLFGPAWNRENGSMPQKRHPAMVFGISFLMSVIAATAFSAWLGPEPAPARALGQGALVGLCFVAASFGINYQFAQRSSMLWAIDGGYHTVQFILFGLVLGLWH